MTNLINIFSTPIWDSHYPQFYDEKDSIISALKEYKKNNSSVCKSNISGYHSDDKIHHLKELKNLAEFISFISMNAAKDLKFDFENLAITEMWVNFNDNPHCMNIDHIHNQVFSGVFYLNCPEGSGELVIRNESINRLWMGSFMSEEKTEHTAESIHMIPEEGKLILFPAYLPHSVLPNRHNEERISISFNIMLFK